MSAAITIRPEPLTKEAFLPFGQVLETDGVEPELINFGNTRKYARLAEISISDAGSGQLSIYRSSAIAVPFRIRLMERHPLGSQVFYPLHQRPFPVVVAPPHVLPGPGNLRVFLTNGRQGVNFFAGVWHHYQLSLGQDLDYIVVDRGGNGDNYEDHRLEEEVMLDI